MVRSATVTRSWIFVLSSSPDMVRAFSPYWIFSAAAWLGQGVRLT